MLRTLLKNRLRRINRDKEIIALIKSHRVGHMSGYDDAIDDVITDLADSNK